MRKNKWYAVLGVRVASLSSHRINYLSIGTYAYPTFCFVNTAPQMPVGRTMGAASVCAVSENLSASSGPAQLRTRPACSSRGNTASRPTIPARAGLMVVFSQLTAFFTSALILASSSAVNAFSAKATGHSAPSSRFAGSLKPSVA